MNETKYQIFMIRIWTLLAIMLCAVIGYGGVYIVMSKLINWYRASM